MDNLICVFVLDCDKNSTISAYKYSAQFSARLSVKYAAAFQNYFLASLVDDSYDVDRDST